MSDRVDWERLFSITLPHAWGVVRHDQKLDVRLYERICPKGDYTDIILKDSGGIATLKNPRRRPLFRLSFEGYRDKAYRHLSNGVPSHKCDFLILSEISSTGGDVGSALFIEITSESHVDHAPADQVRGATTMRRKEEQLVDSLALVHKDPETWQAISSMPQRICLVADKRYDKPDEVGSPQSDLYHVGVPWTDTILEAESMTQVIDKATIREETEYPSPSISRYGFRYCRILYPDYLEVL